ncbi:hypothetical protein GCM10009133_05840 [Cocleimonas flava]|nr:acyltransferase [Cocleimonas flava]
MSAIRMNWLDISRLAAAFSIIGIHTTTDPKGKAFIDYDISERVFPVLMRTTAELASTEFFILVSLFLLAFKLERKPMPYGATMKLQMRRLLVPFVFWTFFYAFFVLIKANAFGYLDPMLEKLTKPETWASYFLLGKSQYHMHFIPTIFLIFLFHPVFKLALKAPILGLLVVPFLAFNLSMSTWIWGNISDRNTLEYLIRGIKVLSYIGYGFAAYSILGLWQQKFDKELSKKIFMFGLLAVSIFFIIKLTHAALSIEAGSYVPKMGAIYYAHNLLPIGVILLFLGSQHFNWPEKISDFSKFTFGTYLMHPAVIDIIDIFLKGVEMAPYQLVLFKYTFTLSIVLALSILISKIPLLAWTIGLGPLPFANRTSGKLTTNEVTDKPKVATTN